MQIKRLESRKSLELPLHPISAINGVFGGDHVVEISKCFFIAIFQLQPGIADDAAFFVQDVCGAIR
jgi:hypothetical protein